jgi:hypothetical protein
MRSNRAHRLTWLLFLAQCVAPGAAVLAQQTPASSAPPASAPAPSPTPRPLDIPPPSQLEPGVNTTAPAAASAPTATPAAAAPRKDDSRARKGADRLELETTDITGNRELPKVLYIVPWKRSDLSDLAGKPPNSLLDEVLQPVDRDVFQRENRYYDALKPDVQGPKAGAAPLSGDKP